MPNPILIKTVLLATDRRTWKGEAIVLGAILTPFLLLVVMLCSMFQGTASHNNAAVREYLERRSAPVRERPQRAGKTSLNGGDVKTIEISLWLEQPRYKAIQRALKGSDTDLENVMQGRLEEFYRQIVPGQERQRIDKAIEAAQSEAERERIANQKISAFHIVENGQITDFVSRQPMDLLAVARQLRRYLREELPSKPSRFIDCVAAESWLSKWKFQALAEERMEDVQRIVGVYSLDFDQGEVSVMCPFQGWKCYGMRDISVAVYHATQKEWQATEVQRTKFLEHLNGRETSVQQEKGPTMQML